MSRWERCAPCCKTYFFPEEIMALVEIPMRRDGDADTA